MQSVLTHPSADAHEPPPHAGHWARLQGPTGARRMGGSGLLGVQRKETKEPAEQKAGPRGDREHIRPSGH